MNSTELRERINIKRPRYSSTRRELIELLARKGSLKGDFTQFGPFYQIFMYAFFIGYKRGERLPMGAGVDRIDFLEIGKWKPEGIIDYMLMLILNKTDELKFDWNELEELDEEQIEVKIKDIISAIEEYANAGFAYLQEKLDNEKTEFLDPFVFVNILSEVTA